MTSTYTVWSGDLYNTYETSDQKQAFQLFLVDVVESERVWEIGLMMVVEDVETGDEYTMWTVPALYLAGVLDAEEAVLNIAEGLGVTEYEAEKLLQEAAEEHAWLADALDPPDSH